MTLRDPQAYRDKTLDWFQFFGELRRRELAELVTDDMLQEHAGDPQGCRTRHSKDLREVVTYARSVPLAGKLFVHAVRPNETYRWARMGPRGGTTEHFGDREFGSEEEALHATFLARLIDQGVIQDSSAVGSEGSR